MLARALALPRPPEVIVATGNGAAEAVVAALRGGAYDAVAKPYRMAEVELLVRRAAEKRSAARRGRGPARGGRAAARGLSGAAPAAAPRRCTLAG